MAKNGPFWQIAVSVFAGTRAMASQMRPGEGRGPRSRGRKRRVKGRKQAMKGRRPRSRGRKKVTKGRKQSDDWRAG